MIATFDLQHQYPSSVQYHDCHPPEENFRLAVLQGLSQPQKAIPPQFLYDKRGAELFDQICQLEEYYLTRTEMAILSHYAAAIAPLIEDSVLIEFGSGSSQKIRILLDAAPRLKTYIALDISKQHLYESCVTLANHYPTLEAIAICTDYTQPLDLPKLPALHQQRVGFFPGSSIGNLDPTEAIQFLQNVATVLQPQGGLLIGVDLKKDQATLEAAYDDAQGVSAAFALNLLTRMNRELDADFNLEHFAYQAFYNPIGRIEMYLVSLVNQIVTFGTTAIPFHQGEKIRTEYSYKYSIPEFQALAQQAGFQPLHVWTDPNQLFSVHYLQVMASGT